ncbi:hypothetical protein yrohd0001_28490 [Yersinia rohdei ATCC 43380]|nr:hypothetical protein yrohd0001_28490 [Yersinia rohdei ATCC 43380]
MENVFGVTLHLWRINAAALGIDDLWLIMASLWFVFGQK